MLPRLLLAAVLLSGLSAPVQAQGARGRQPAMPTLPIEFEGVVEGLMPPNILVVIDANNLPWRVLVPQTAKVQVIGAAEADFLQTGHVVEFQGEIDLRGALKGKVDELTLVTPSVEKPMGLFLAGSADGEGGFAAGFGDGGMGGKPAKKAAKGGKNATQAGTYQIVGRLMVGRGGKISVQTGRGLVPLELTDRPTIAVDFADYTVALKGDKASIKGMMMAGRPGLAQANEVKIELKEPLAGPKKKGPPPKPEGKKPAKRPKKDKDEGLPEAADDK